MGQKVPGPLRIYTLLKDSPLKISEKLSPPKLHHFKILLPLPPLISREFIF